MRLFIYNKPIGTDCEETREFVKEGEEAVKVYPVSTLEKEGKGLVVYTDDESQVETLKAKTAAAEMEFHIDLKQQFNAPTFRKIRADLSGKGIINWTEAYGIIISIKPCSEQILKDICKNEGFDVTLLKKYRIGNLKIKKVALGTLEEYTPEEVEAFLAL